MSIALTLPWTPPYHAPLIPPPIKPNSCSNDLFLPGLNSLVLAPYNLTKTIVDLFSSALTHDKWAILEASIKSSTVCMGFAYAVEALSNFINQLSNTATHLPSFTFTTIIGLTVYVIEGCHQFIKLIHQISFHDSFSFFTFNTTCQSQLLSYHHLKGAIEKLMGIIHKHRPVFEKEFGPAVFSMIDQSLYSLYLDADFANLPVSEIRRSFIEMESKLKQEILYKDLFFLFKNYCSSETSKTTSLANRVEIWCAKDVSNEIQQLLKHLRSDDAQDVLLAIEKSENLLKKIEAQSLKHLIIQSLALVAIAISITGLIGLFFLPPFSIIVLMLLSSGLSITRTVISSCMLENEGFVFTLSSLIPSWLRIKDTKNNSTKLPHHVTLKA